MIERAIQTMKNLTAKMEDGNNLTKSVNRAEEVMRFKIIQVAKNDVRITSR